MVHQALEQGVRELWRNQDNENVHIPDFTNCKVSKSVMVCPILEGHSISISASAIAYLEEITGVQGIRYYEETVPASANREAYVIKRIEVPTRVEDKATNSRGPRFVSRGAGRNWERAATFFVLFLLTCFVIYYRQMVGKLF